MSDEDEDTTEIKTQATAADTTAEDEKVEENGSDEEKIEEGQDRVSGEENDGDPEQALDSAGGETMGDVEILKRVFCCCHDDEQIKTLPLQDDIYTLMFLAKPWSYAFFYAVGIAVLQISFALAGIQNALDKTNHCDIHLDVPLIVKILQGISLILPIYTIEGIAKTIPMIRPMIRITQGGIQIMVKDYEFLRYDAADQRFTSIEEKANIANPRSYSKQMWIFSLILRCILCFVIYIANIILVIVSNDVSGLVIKFTILVFLFEWSTLALKAVNYNLLPKPLSQQIKELHTKIYVRDKANSVQNISATFQDFKMKYRKKKGIMLPLITAICLFALGISLIGLRYDIYNTKYLEEWQATCNRCYKFQVEITSTSNASVYSGNYVECNSYKHRPIFKKEFKSFGESNHEQFFYCKKNDKWALTDKMITKEHKCDDDWLLLHHQNANKTFSIENLDETSWKYREDNDPVNIIMTCLEHKTENDIKEMKGECDKTDYIDFVPSYKFPFCNKLIHFVNDTWSDEHFILAKDTVNTVVTAYGHPVYEKENNETAELVIFAGYRWYHIIVTSNVVRDLKSDAVENIDEWREIISESHQSFYSNVTFDIVPTGALNWFKVDPNSNPPRSDGNETYNQRFECFVDGALLIDCSNPDACNKNGICLENILLKHNDKATKSDEFFYCSEAMIESPEYICGGKCRCDNGKSGEFCQENTTTASSPALTPAPWEPAASPSPALTPAPSPTSVESSESTPEPSIETDIRTLTGSQRVHVEFSSDVYVFHDIDLTEHLMEHNASYGPLISSSFNKTSPPDLHFSHFSGTYVKNKTDDRYYQDGKQESVHGMFYYCTQYKAWVFTIVPLAIQNGIVPNATKDECDEQYGWIMRSPSVESLSLHMVPSTVWTIWTGISAVNSDVAITCMECTFNTDCGIGHGKCEDGTDVCNCTESFEGPFCERSKPCMEIVKYNGTLDDVTLSNTKNDVKMGQHEIMHGPFLRQNDTRKIHDRHVFVWNNKDEIELILYSGFRWYHMNMTEEYYKRFEDHLMKNTFDTYWGNVFLDITRYYSEETQNYIPTGDLQWFEKGNDALSDLFDESVRFNQQFECLNVTCGVPMVCGFNGKCIGNIILAENNVLVTSGNDKCNQSMTKSTDDYVCGGRCDCDEFYDGHFCETKVFD